MECLKSGGGDEMYVDRVGSLNMIKTDYIKSTKIQFKKKRKTHLLLF